MGNLQHQGKRFIYFNGTLFAMKHPLTKACNQHLLSTEPMNKCSHVKLKSVGEVF